MSAHLKEVCRREKRCIGGCSRVIREHVRERDVEYMKISRYFV